jgi:hypothetical protein
VGIRLSRPESRSPKELIMDVVGCGLRIADVIGTGSGVFNADSKPPSTLSKRLGTEAVERITDVGTRLESSPPIVSSTSFDTVTLDCGLRTSVGTKIPPPRPIFESNSTRMLGILLVCTGGDCVTRDGMGELSILMSDTKPPSTLSMTLGTKEVGCGLKTLVVTGASMPDTKSPNRSPALLGREGIARDLVGIKVGSSKPSAENKPPRRFCALLDRLGCGVGKGKDGRPKVGS